ncbi:Formamidopyrimidine-DNA glycosylase H2TH domain-containing protein [Geranomyces variabilis]|nr:Formamidopyrimidine-DNA glycosylase H2TH domain-containing protein [Geranomyces variabilis]
MPELPEVERARKLIHDAFVGQNISAVTTLVDDIVYSECTNVDFEGLNGRTLVDTGRRGKVFYMLMDKGPHPVLHLGMTGSVRVGATPHLYGEFFFSLKFVRASPFWQIKGEAGLEYKDFSTAGDDWPPKYTKFVLTFAPSGRELAFTDPRRLARIRLVDGDPLLQRPINELGFDPSINMPELDAFAASLNSRKCPIKALLLDQKFSAGVGNWVADEVLYQARIHPGTFAAALTDEEVTALHRELHNVIATAVAVNADSAKFPEGWLFHQRWGKGRTATRAGTMPDGSAIVFVTVGGRTSAVVPSRQILHGAKGAEAKWKNKEKPAAVKTEAAAARKRKAAAKRVKREAVKVEAKVVKVEQEEPSGTTVRRSARVRALGAKAG